MQNYIRVNFIDSLNHPMSNTKYIFRDPKDELRVGDIVTDPRYSNRMRVVEITRCQYMPTYNGVVIKNIQPSMIEKFSERFADSQRKAISITLQEAREWYAGSNPTLKRLALQAFTEEQIIGLSYEKIRISMSESTMFVTPATKIPIGTVPENTLHAKMLTLGKYFNNGIWLKKPNERGYFVTLSTAPDGYKATVAVHNTITQPGIVYFKNEEDAVKVLKILAKDFTMYME